MASKRKPEGYISLKNIALVISSVLVLILLFAGQGSSIIFLYSDDCDECSKIAEEVKQITVDAGLKFKKMEYTEQELIPGLIFIHDGKVLISGYSNAESFKMQLCGFTEMKKACDIAGESE